MGFQVTFRQILEEKMQISEEKSAHLEGECLENVRNFRGESTSPTTFETLIASFLRRDVNFNFTSPSDNPTEKNHKIRSAYGTPPPRETRQKPRPQEKTVLVKDLKSDANQALQLLVELGATELKTLALISESIVKRAFRRLALRLHPDQNPHKNNGRDFRRAHAAYTLLLRNIKN